MSGCLVIPSLTTVVPSMTTVIPSLSRDLKTNIMETIIGLLFILLPIIFKLIGKKFEQSGKTDKADVLKELAKAFGEDGDDAEPQVEYDNDGQIINVPPKPKIVTPPAPKVVTAPAPKPRFNAEKPKMAVEGVKSINRRPMLLEEEPKKKREKIDLKKMVVYSEIMKPKFEE